MHNNNVALKLAKKPQYIYIYIYITGDTCHLFSDNSWRNDLENAAA